jgi:hypothetical protein
MTKNQEIKLELLKEFYTMKNPVGFCREAYKFLTENEEAVPSVKVENTVNAENGIYLVYQNGNSVPFKKGMAKALASDVSGIGVVYDGHAFQVALKDLGEWPLFRNYEDCPKESPFYKTECEGLHDWDFVSTTNHIKEIGTDIPLPEGWYIPTLAVLEVMCFLKKEINEAIKFAGGKPMPDDYHWSSTEYHRNFARSVGFSNGYASNYDKYGSSVVRPVTAFNLEA